MSLRDAPISSFACFAVYSASHAFNRVYKPLLDELRLTYPQYLVMVLLWEQDRLTVTQICDRMLVEASTVTPLLQRLEARGLIRRVRDKVDRRQVWAMLTEQGRMLHDEAIQVPESVQAASGFTVEDLARLTNEITRLRENLARAAADPKPA